MTKHNFSLTLQAQDDMRNIWLYIAKDNPIAAENMAEQFERIFSNIANDPYIGHTREDLTDKPVLFFPVKSYLIIYNAETQPIHILRILSAYRNIPRIM